jgi:peptidoglycan/LPS O-acetylase OafA/YrhL
VIEDRRGGSVLRPLLISVLLIGLAALVGWILLITVTFALVLACYAAGAALIVLPLLVAGRVVGGQRSSRERWGRIGVIAALVCGGIALIVVAHLIQQHKWLLIVLPAAAVALAVASNRVRDRLDRRRKRREGLRGKRPGERTGVGPDPAGAGAAPKRPASSAPPW